VSLPEDLAAALRSGGAVQRGEVPAVAGRIEDGRLLLDLRSVLPPDDKTLALAVLAAAGRPVGPAAASDVAVAEVSGPASGPAAVSEVAVSEVAVSEVAVSEVAASEVAASEVAASEVAGPASGPAAQSGGPAAPAAPASVPPARPSEP
jgi:hypothetical protein